VAAADPPKLTTEAATKFVPVIVSVKAAPPAAAVLGEIMLIVGLTDAGWLPEPPHPARSTIVTIPKITSVLRRQEGPRNASGDMACSSATRERGLVWLANATFNGVLLFRFPSREEYRSQGHQASYLCNRKRRAKDDRFAQQLISSRYIVEKSAICDARCCCAFFVVFCPPFTIF
jgi:hypothetical protein